MTNTTYITVDDEMLKYNITSRKLRTVDDDTDYYNKTTLTYDTVE